jgi:hypothetical protein
LARISTIIANDPNSVKRLSSEPSPHINVPEKEHRKGRKGTKGREHTSQFERLKT